MEKAQKIAPPMVKRQPKGETPSPSTVALMFDTRSEPRYKHDLMVLMMNYTDTPRFRRCATSNAFNLVGNSKRACESERTPDRVLGMTKLGRRDRAHQVVTAPRLLSVRGANLSRETLGPLS